ncbi:Uncharacterised protein [uncultured archaeon]|nr:Uncharacterised protein [uncultured archaeon]
MDEERIKVAEDDNMITDLVSRVKWKTVLVTVFIVALVLILLIGGIKGSFNVKNGIGIKSSLDPDSVKPGGRSRLDVEVQNDDESNSVNIQVTAATYDSRLIFDSGLVNDTQWTETVRVGPKETRKLSKTMQLLPGALEGKYRIDVSASDTPGFEGTKDSLYLTVEKAS